VLVNRSVAALATGRGVHLGALTHVLAGRYGEREAVEDPAPTPGFDHASVRTFQDLEEVVARSAAALLDAGVGTGDRVLVLLDNRLDVALMAFAVARLGALPIPVNHRLTGREVGAIVDATGAGHALADPAYVDGLPVELAVVTSDGLGAAVRHAPQARLAPDPAADPEATAILLTTSGTTGTPKAAALTSRGLLKALGRLVALPVGWPRGPRGGRDRVLAVLPLTHVMGLSTLLGALAAGVPLVRRARFDPHEVLDLIEQRRPNAVVAVPTMYADLETAGAAGRDLGSVQLWVSAADAMPTERARRFQRYGAAMRVAGVAVGSAAFLDVFGMVELSGPAAVRLLPPSVVGAAPVPGLALALPGVEVRVVDDDGAEVPPGRLGHVQWRGAGVLEGYEGHDGAGPDVEGWFGAGDRGRSWRAGLIQLAGRDRDRLKVSGFSVFPAEVEEELHAAPGVAELAVVGVPDERTGERLVALVVASDDFDPDAFLVWARRRVTGYRRPAEVRVVSALPRGGHGKLDRDRATALAFDAEGGSDA
jgi:acyl-CoA synthetase (AMP-forming)/AMP-acid ligase II